MHARQGLLGAINVEIARKVGLLKMEEKDY